MLLGGFHLTIRNDEFFFPLTSLIKLASLSFIKLKLASPALRSLATFVWPAGPRQEALAPARAAASAASAVALPRHGTSRTRGRSPAASRPGLRAALPTRVISHKHDIRTTRTYHGHSDLLWDRINVHNNEATSERSSAARFSWKCKLEPWTEPVRYRTTLSSKRLTSEAIESRARTPKALC